MRIILKVIICLNDCLNEEFVNYFEDNIGYFINIKLLFWFELLVSIVRKLFVFLFEYF